MSRAEGLLVRKGERGDICVSDGILLYCGERTLECVVRTGDCNVLLFRGFLLTAIPRNFSNAYKNIKFKKYRGIKTLEYEYLGKVTYQNINDILVHI